MKTPESDTRHSYACLRAVCRDFKERLVLGEAIRQGWPAQAIEREASKYKGRSSKDHKRRLAVYEASKRRYYSPEERAANLAVVAQIQAREDARKAIKATKTTRPAIPSKDYAPIRAACRSMLDCDRFQTVLDEGWKAEDILYLARVHSEVAVHIPFKETPGAIRFVLELIEGRPAGQYSGWLPRPNQHQLKDNTMKAAAN